MQKIKCPKCGRDLKLVECTCYEKNRKRIMLTFTCHHYPFLVYNIPCSMDDNTILKHFKATFKEYFEKPYFTYNGDFYLD